MSIQDEARNGRYLRTAINDRQIDELIGIARGLIADNELNDSEIEFLQRWLAANSSVRAHPMIGLLLERMRDIFADGYVDETERAEMTDALAKFAANDFELGEVLKTSTLPLTEPQPNIEFADRRFCFTGTFTFGRRADCERAVENFGGICGNLTKTTDYLVVGDYATDAWKHSSFGRKIEQAVQWRAEGMAVAIVAENHWRTYF